MKNKIIFLGIAAIVITTAAVLFYRFTLSAAPEESGEMNFNQIGNLVHNNPGQEQDTWYLIYERPGEPGLSKRLEFDSASACAINAPATPCDLSTLVPGTRVRVEGREVIDGVLVRTIQSPEPLQEENPDIATPGTTTRPGVSTGTTTRPGTTTTPATSTGTTTRPGTTTPGTSSGTSTATTTTQDGLTVKLYYYNQALDQGPGGTQCTEKGLVAVTRVIPRTNTPLQDTLKALLRGELTAEEKAEGMTSEFPLSRVTLMSASNNNLVITLTFRDPRNRTSGGSCRVNIIRKSLEATAKQFPGVESVRFMPAELFQP